MGRSRLRNRPDDEQARRDAEIAAKGAAKAERDADLEQKIALGYEPSDVRARPVLMIGAATAVVLGLVGAVMLGLFALFSSLPVPADPPISPLANQTTLPPEPRLEVNPAENLEILRATESALLNSYGWVDQGSGVARMPIDRAMDLLAERGLPTAAATVPPPSTTQTPAAQPTGPPGPTVTPRP
jgi:hypothetical protein